MSNDAPIPTLSADAAGKAAQAVATPQKPGKAPVVTALPGKPDPEAVAKAPALSPVFVVSAEQRRMVYAAEIPPNVEFDRIMEPDYWAHVAHRFQEGTIIECQRADNAWRAELMVRKITLGKHEVHCWKLSFVDLEAQVAKSAMPLREQFMVEWGGASKWRVRRKLDNEVIHHGESSRADADTWLDAHIASAKL